MKTYCWTGIYTLRIGRGKTVVWAASIQVSPPLLVQGAVTEGTHFFSTSDCLHMKTKVSAYCKLFSCLPCQCCGGSKLSPTTTPSVRTILTTQSHSPSCISAPHSIACNTDRRSRHCARAGSLPRCWYRLSTQQRRIVRAAAASCSAVLLLLVILFSTQPGSSRSDPLSALDDSAHELSLIHI